MTSLPYFQPCAGVNLMIKGGVAHGWLMETSHEFRLLHRFEPAFCNPEVGEPISHPFRDSLNQVAHLGSAQKQCMFNACKYSTLLCSGMYCEGCKFYVHSVQCSMQLL